MSEPIGLPTDKRGRKSLLFIDPISEIEKGVEGKKVLAKTIVEGKSGRSRPGPVMFVKNYESIDDALDADKKYIKLYNAFKIAKAEGKIEDIPLVPTYRRSGKRIISTDLTFGGKNVIIDKHTKPDEILPELKNLDELIEEAKIVARISFEDGEIYLSSGAYCVSVDKDTGIGRLYIVDLDSENLDVRELRDKEKWLSRSLKHVDFFKDMIEARIQNAKH